MVLVFLRLCTHQIFLLSFWLLAQCICLALENWSDTSMGQDSRIIWILASTRAPVCETTVYLFSHFLPPRYHDTTEEQFGPSTDEGEFRKSGQQEEDHLGVDSRTTRKGEDFFFALVFFLYLGLNPVKGL